MCEIARIANVFFIQYDNNYHFFFSFFFLCDRQSVSNYDKIRIIALYCMIKNGITEENLRKLFSHAQIGEKEQDMVRNLSLLGVNTISDVSCLSCANCKSFHFGI